MTSVLVKGQENDQAVFTASAGLAQLPNGNGTIAAIFNPQNTNDVEVCGLTKSDISDWFHTLTIDGSGTPFDDDGEVGSAGSSTPTWNTSDWYLYAETWTIAGGVATETFHIFNLTAGGSWAHIAGGNNGGARVAASGAVWLLGSSGDGGNSPFAIALSAAWAGAALTNAQIEALLTNSRTSDWYGSAAGHPTLLIECTSLTPTDIGSAPSTFVSIGPFTLDGTAPTWNFDGRGSGGGTTFTDSGSGVVPVSGSGSDLWVAPTASEDDAGDAVIPVVGSGHDTHAHSGSGQGVFGVGGSATESHHTSAAGTMPPLVLPVSAVMDSASKSAVMDPADTSAVMDPHEIGAVLDA